MPRDYAKRKPAPRRRTQTRRASTRVAFHGPSFAAGIALGAALVLAAAWAPDLIGTPVAVATADQPEPTPIEFSFSFQEELPSRSVAADPSSYPVEPDARDDRAILLQAASFRAIDDAENLRASLLLQDLPATMERIERANGTWFRVNVGPFDDRTQANRALTRLRRQGIAPLERRSDG